MSINDYAIEGRAFHLNKIFSSEFEYIIPSYQRPYSWQEEQVIELFDDLYSFYQNSLEESYFLGSIVVIKQGDKPLSEVVDGQQRLTSLTILLAALTTYFSDEDKAEGIECILQPAKKAQNISAKPRLTLRPRDKEFFRQYVQELNFKKLLELDTAQLPNDAQRNIQKNSHIILDKISENFKNDDKEVFRFFSFLITRCCMVVVSTPSQKSAFRIFSVMNNRGLDLLPTDIIKADLIGKINSVNQDAYTEKWEDLEQEAGRNGFNDLFSHIRMIHVRAKAKKSTLEELQEQVLPKIKSSEEFVDKLLRQYTEAYTSIKNEKYVASQYADEVNKVLMWLNKINNSDWLPVAIVILVTQQNNSYLVLQMLKKLECLAAYLHLCAKNINYRIECYSKVLMELAENPDVMPLSFDLSDEQKKEWRTVLNGNVYNLIAARRNYLILRTDALISDGAASYDNSHQKGLLTIEHVLPQTLNKNSEWARWWNDEDVKKWVHRLANLVPLNKRRNSAAYNYDFSIKKQKYFAGNQNVSSYALTSQVLNKNEWKLDDVQARQKELLEKLFQEWKLGSYDKALMELS